MGHSFVSNDFVSLSLPFLMKGSGPNSTQYTYLLWKMRRSDEQHLSIFFFFFFGNLVVSGTTKD